MSVRVYLSALAIVIVACLVTISVDSYSNRSIRKQNSDILNARVMPVRGDAIKEVELVSASFSDCEESSGVTKCWLKGSYRISDDLFPIFTQVETPTYYAHSFQNSFLDSGKLVSLFTSQQTFKVLENQYEESLFLIDSAISEARSEREMSVRWLNNHAPSQNSIFNARIISERGDAIKKSGLVSAHLEDCSDLSNITTCWLNASYRLNGVTLPILAYVEAPPHYEANFQNVYFDGGRIIPSNYSQQSLKALQRQYEESLFLIDTAINEINEERKLAKQWAGEFILDSKASVESAEVTQIENEVDSPL